MTRKWPGVDVGDDNLAGPSRSLPDDNWFVISHALLRISILHTVTPISEVAVPFIAVDRENQRSCVACVPVKKKKKGKGVKKEHHNTPRPADSDASGIWVSSSPVPWETSLHCPEQETTTNAFAIWPVGSMENPHSHSLPLTPSNKPMTQS